MESKNPIPQVDVTGMPDETKKKIDPIFRLESPGTTAETDFLQTMLNQMNGEATEEEYLAAKARLDQERNSP